MCLTPSLLQLPGRFLGSLANRDIAMTGSPSTPAVHLRHATQADVPVILNLIHELAEYERKEVAATEELLRESLFGPRATAEVLLAEMGAATVGYAVYFSICSTFAGRAGIYLEDLYVQPAVRGQGIGRKMLAHVARLAIERNCDRLVWSVLDWNAPAIRFYKELGAQPAPDWQQYRLTGQELTRLSAS